MINIALLGSTGSIGQQTLEVINHYRDRYKVVALSCHQNVTLALKQVKQFQPKYIAVADRSAAFKLKKELPEKICLLVGEEEIAQLAAVPEVDLVVNALVGSAGLKATLTAIASNKTLALANKESLVAGGSLVKKALSKSKAKILPVDSEHNALFQCLQGENIAEVANLIITASGGPFLNYSQEQLKKVTVKQALAHPKWQMGPKITIDSATLLNKAFEVIEAHYLFNLPYNQIKVLIHPQSIIHGLVEFVDGSLKAHLGPTDMKVAILYCLSYPHRVKGLTQLDLTTLPSLELNSLNEEKFVCYKLAMQAIKSSEAHLVALNASNEEAVKAFLEEKINFIDIAKVIATVLEAQTAVSINSYEQFLAVNQKSRLLAQDYLKERVLS